MLVFGPGTGELVLVRAPPGDWLVVDGCAVGTTSYAVRTLEYYRAFDQVRLVALTHAHEDHAGGLGELIDKVTAGEPSSWPKLGLIWPAPSNQRATRDLRRYFTGGRVSAALSAILDRWRRQPRTRWPMKEGDERVLGDARVRICSPADDVRTAAIAAWRVGRHFDPNRVATAMEVTWKEHRIVLGSDLVEQPGRGWTAAIKVSATLTSHDAIKVPHHGSVAALHDPVLERRRRGNDRWFLVTPFASQSLPRFDRGGGIARMLGHADVVHLTGLPRKHGDQPGEPLNVRRSQLTPSGKVRMVPVTPGFPDCWVMVEFGAATQPRRLVHGLGSVTVRRG